MGWLALLALIGVIISRSGKTGGVGDHAMVQGDGIYLGDPTVWPNIGEQTKGRLPSPFALGTMFSVDPDKIALTKDNRTFVKTCVMEVVGYRYNVSIGMYRYRLRFTINGSISPVVAGYSELVITQGLASGAFKQIKVG